MTEKIKMLQITERLAYNTRTNRIYDLSGQYVAHVDLEKNELVYNSDLPEILKAEVGVFLMQMNNK